MALRAVDCAISADNTRILFTNNAVCLFASAPSLRIFLQVLLYSNCREVDLQGEVRNIAIGVSAACFPWLYVVHSAGSVLCEGTVF